MTATIHTLRPHAPRPTPDDTLRADCERLMRRLVREKVLVEALRGLLRTHDDPADPESAVAMEREIRLVEQARAALKAAP